MEKQSGLLFMAAGTLHSTRIFPPLLQLILPSSKKYLFAGRTEGETIEIYNKITQLRKDIKTKYNLQSGITGNKEYRDVIEERDNELEFERCDSDKEEEKYFSTNAYTTPKK